VLENEKIKSHFKIRKINTLLGRRDAENGNSDQRHNSAIGG
jgi:hypothetical protein